MKICILGAGAYGLALALTCHRNHQQVIVWTKIETEKEEIITTRQNKKALPNILIPEGITITTDLSCIKDCELAILAVPIAFFRSTCLELKNYVHENLHFCIATKGIENQTEAFCHEILMDTISTKQVALLSGPTFAIDLASHSPSGLSLAANLDTTYEVVKNALQNQTLTIEKRNDMIGVEICGAIKNIMAIISGMLDGMNATETTKALFLTKALQETGNLITNLGGSYETITSFAGLGDLLLTCNSTKSRNYSLGILLATTAENEYAKINDYLQTNTVEGYYTLISIYSLIQKRRLSSPLIELLYHILFDQTQKKELFTILTK